jgi:hypothetical protein
MVLKREKCNSFKFSCSNQSTWASSPPNLEFPSFQWAFWELVHPLRCSSSLKPEVHREASGAQVFLLLLYFFIRIYSLNGGGICSDNSDQTYIVRYLHCPPCLSPQAPPHPTQSNCKRFPSSAPHRYMKSINYILSPPSPSFTNI